MSKYKSLRTRLNKTAALSSAMKTGNIPMLRALAKSNPKKRK
jgi:hypothetical protein